MVTLVKDGCIHDVSQELVPQFLAAGWTEYKQPKKQAEKQSKKPKKEQ